LFPIPQQFASCAGILLFYAGDMPCLSTLSQHAQKGRKRHNAARSITSKITSKPVCRACGGSMHMAQTHRRSLPVAAGIMHCADAFERSHRRKKNGAIKNRL